MKKIFAVLLLSMLLGMFCGANAEMKVGDFVTLGLYEQDDDPDNGREPIEWQVLAVEEDRALVISRYGLESRWYHYPQVDITWETSNLRKWLNEDFYGDSFNAEEQEKILDVKNSTAGDQESGTDGGADTQDKVFVLSIEEAKTYFQTDNDRLCEATAYEKKHGAFVRSSTGM